MPMRTIVCLLGLVVTAACAPGGPIGAGDVTASTFPELRGPYLGQELPGLEPRLFAPGVVSTGLATRDVTMTPDGNELYFSVTADGALYFTREGADGVSATYHSRLVDGVYTEPEKLGPEVNCGQNRFNVYIAPDESFAIAPAIGREDSLGGVDYYVVFRSAADAWSEPINLGEAVNQSEGREWSASLSPDGGYLFFMSSRTTAEDDLSFAGSTVHELLEFSTQPGQGSSGIWWVSAEIIERLRP